LLLHLLTALQPSAWKRHAVLQLLEPRQQNLLQQLLLQLPQLPQPTQQQHARVLQLHQQQLLLALLLPALLSPAELHRLPPQHRCCCQRV
jgi:hypothetical protein